MNEHDEYLRERGERLVPNWALIVVTLICLGFWGYVAYNVARWVP